MMMSVPGVLHVHTYSHAFTLRLLFLRLSAARQRNSTLKVAPSDCFPLPPNVICETSCSQGQREAFGFQVGLSDSQT